MFTFDDNKMRRAVYTVGEDGKVSVAAGAATLGGPTIDLGPLGTGYLFAGAGPILQLQWARGGGQFYGGVDLGRMPWGTNLKLVGSASVVRSTDDVHVADINTSQADFFLIDGSNNFQFDIAQSIRYDVTYMREDFEFIGSTGVKVAEMTALQFSLGVDFVFTQTEQNFVANVTQPNFGENRIETDLKSSQVGLYAGAQVVQHILPNFSIFAGAMIRPGVSKLELDADQTFQGNTISVEDKHTQHTFGNRGKRPGR